MSDPEVIYESYGNKLIGAGATGGGSSEQVQADWGQSDDTQPDFIKNKPDINNLKINSVKVSPKINGEWITKTWTGLTYFSGENIWTDGENIYYSGGSDQYILDKNTSTWSPKTWNGLPGPILIGKNIWTDGDNIYYSHEDFGNYVLDKTTSTWSTKTWSGLTSFNGENIWTDGEKIYYSSTHILNKSTSTWSTKTWIGLTSFDGSEIWTDGADIYCRNYVLSNRISGQWETKSWTGLASPQGQYIWTDGKNIYHATGGDPEYSATHMLNKNSTAWLRIYDSSGISGQQVWTDGDNIYYSYESTHKVLSKKINIR